MSVSVVLRLAVLAVLILELNGVQSTAGSKLRPIHIGLSIDDHSLKDLAILINSVVHSATEPNDLVFHIVACGKDLMAAIVLKKSIASTMSECLPNVKHELVAFMLPAESGFALQLGHLKKKSNHWNSQSGADMVRFFMPSLFSHVDRILYLDNDIIVSCCLEEVYDTPFEEHQIVGIALDSLAWATVTQFQRHYNASHPLVVKNMRRRPLRKGGDSTGTSTGTDTNTGSSSNEVSTKEFSAALPRYPNDGVLLIDVARYNSLKILDTMNEIAQKNGEGEYVVNLGTQQFTVLALWDRWKELTPRANLRHFPDMARGYLMWFYYNGFLHYAGQHKPKQLCLTTTAENAQGRIPYLRAMSYTAWALSNYQVNLQCPNDNMASVPECLPHVHRADTLVDLYSVLHRIMSVSPDSSLLYMHIGPLYGDYTAEAHRNSSVYHMPVYTGPTYNRTVVANHYAATASAKASATLPTRPVGSVREDLVDTIFRAVLHNATWSVRAFDFKLSRADHSSGLLTKAGFTLFDPKTAGGAKKRGKKEAVPRTIVVQTKHFCDSSTSPYKTDTAANTTSSARNTTAHNADANTVTKPTPPPACQSVLTEIKAEGRAHWDAQVIVVDVTPPQSFLTYTPPTPTVTTSTSSANTKGKKTESAVSSSADSHESLSKHNSLGVLLNLDLVFMRPKIVLVRLSAASRAALTADATTADRFLRQNGYLTSQHSGPECGDSRQVHISKHTHHHSQQEQMKNGATATAAGTNDVSATHAAPNHHIATAHFVCVWGLRINEFEFFSQFADVKL